MIYIRSFTISVFTDCQKSSPTLNNNHGNHFIFFSQTYSSHTLRISAHGANISFIKSISITIFCSKYDIIITVCNLSIDKLIPFNQFYCYDAIHSWMGKRCKWAFFDSSFLRNHSYKMWEFKISGSNKCFDFLFPLQLQQVYNRFSAS